MSLLGAVAGALLLLRLPAAAFEAIVPVLSLISVVLVLVQPRLAAARAATPGGRRGRPRPHRRTPAARRRHLLAGVYGGYFGAAQGVLLMGLLGAVLPEDLQGSTRSRTRSRSS